MSPYRFAEDALLFRWLDRQSDSERCLAMIDWLVGFASDPQAHAHRVPGVKAPVYFTVVPLQPPVVIRFLLDQQFHVIKFLGFGSLP